MANKQKGYTIVEVMLFLAISGALFSLVVFGMNGQQDRLRFKQAMEEVEFRVRSALSNVDQGYTAKANNDKSYNCSAGVSEQVTANASAQCIFVGREVNFCTANDWYSVSRVAPYNNGDYARKDASIAGVIDAGKESFSAPGGVTLDAVGSDNYCRVAALYQTLGVSNNRVPRYQGRALATMVTVDDNAPAKLCFRDSQGTDQWAAIIVTQADVILDMNVQPQCV